MAKQHVGNGEANQNPSERPMSDMTPLNTQVLVMIQTH